MARAETSAASIQGQNGEWMSKTAGKEQLSIELELGFSDQGVQLDGFSDAEKADLTKASTRNGKVLTDPTFDFQLEANPLLQLFMPVFHCRDQGVHHSVHPKKRPEPAWLERRPLFVSRYCTTRAQRMSSYILHIVLMRVNLTSSIRSGSFDFGLYRGRNNTQPHCPGPCPSTHTTWKMIELQLKKR